MAVILLMKLCASNEEHCSGQHFFIYFVCFFNKNEFTKVLDKVLILKKKIVVSLLLHRFCLLLLP